MTREGNTPSTHTKRDDGLDPLAQHRRDIEALDRRILHLVRERLDLARMIGRLKCEHGVPLRNFRVEAQVHARLADAARDLGIDPAIGSDLAHLLISRSVEEQASLMDTVYAGGQLTTLVFGGKGGMGSWMVRFLNSQGHRVEVRDPARGACPVPEVGDLATAANADLIVLATPMDVTGRVLEELATLGSRAIVAEMCSLKAHLEPTFVRVRSAGLRVVSFHPLFGPEQRTLSGRTIVFCTDGDPEDVAFVRGLFSETSARLVEMSAAEHDRRMAVVLGLTHLSNLVFARALAHSGVAAADLIRVAGVTFDRQLATTREVTEENSDLYFQIQDLNPSTPDTACWLTTALTELMTAIRNHDATAFSTLMHACREQLAGASRRVTAGAPSAPGCGAGSPAP